ncbi:MAG: hypothetical protein ACRDE9_03670 [Candidatus Limnocylindria bacterium]
MRFRRVVGGLMAALALISLATSTALAVDSPSGDQAAAWATTWRAYMLANGSPVRDPIGDVGCGSGYCDVSSGGNGTSPSVYVASDGTTVFFRLRLLGDPTAPAAAGFRSTTWVVMIAVNGTAVVAVGLDGKSPQRDFVYVANAAGTAYTEIYATPFTNAGGEQSAGARGLADGTGHYFLDLQVPLWRITQRSGGAVTGSTPVQLFFGTSQSANLAVLNKDYMIGNSVNFEPTSTVTLVPQAGPTGGTPIVTEIPDTSMAPAATLPLALLVLPLLLTSIAVLLYRRSPT